MLHRCGEADVGSAGGCVSSADAPIDSLMLGLNQWLGTILTVTF